MFACARKHGFECFVFLLLTAQLMKNIIIIYNNQIFVKLMLRRADAMAGKPTQPLRHRRELLVVDVE